MPSVVGFAEKALQLLVFAFVDALQDGEPRVLGVGQGDWFKFCRSVEVRNDTAHRFLACGALFQFRGIHRPAQRETAAADFAVTITNFVFVQRHKSINPYISNSKFKFNNLFERLLRIPSGISKSH